MGEWKTPKGYVLTRIDEHYVDSRGMNVQGSDPRRGLMPDGQIEVAHFIEDEPFVWTENDGKGPNASVEARKAALAGTPLAGYSPNVIMLPIEGGYIPPQYHLVHEDDESHGTIEPASVLAGKDSE